MRTVYIQFDAPVSVPAKDGLIKKVLENAVASVFAKVFPKANPDFDDKIEEVKKWLIECEVDTGIPQREIGLDIEGTVLLKMPFGKNYGYWTDNNLLLKDFVEHFNVSEISKESFENLWLVVDGGWIKGTKSLPVYLLR